MSSVYKLYMKQKKITVTLKNKQLNALEDLLYCNLNPMKKIKYTKRVKKLWTRLVNAYDKK